MTTCRQTKKLYSMHSHGHRPEYSQRFQKKGDVNGQQGGRYPASARVHQDLFSCTNPTHPEYAGLKTRLLSFAAWPNHISASVKSIAEAGFFFLGERDRCKCHYCNGGLQNWEEGDDPWFEHAKWFPQCEYVLQQKGLEYVSGINAMFPNLSRPGDSVSHRPIDIPPFEPIQYNSNEDISVPSLPTSNNDVPQMEITTCTTSSISQEENSEELELIEQLKMFGFGCETVSAIVNMKHCKGERFTSVSEMVDAAQEYETNRLTGMVTEPMESMDTEVPEHRLEVDECTSGKDALSQTTDRCELKSKLQSAVVASNCVICGKEERSCVFTSCGHYCCCNDCGQDLHECPLCNVKIASAMRIYRI